MWPLLSRDHGRDLDIYRDHSFDYDYSHNGAFVALIQLYVSVSIMLLFSRLILLCCSSTASRNSTGTLPTTAPTTARSKKRQGGPLNKFIRQLRKLNKHNPNSNSTCEELKGCQRICVGQNEQLTNVSDCSTFKIHCTSRKLFRRSTKSKIQKAKNKKP